MPSNLIPPLATALDIFGVTATVTPLAGLPVTTTVARFRGAAPPAPGTLGMSAAVAVNLQPVLSVSRADVPALPIGSTIVGDFGEGSRTYRVDRIDDGFPDEWRVIVS